MRIIVTGGTGFIGHHLVELLLKRGDHPVVLTRNASKSRSKFHSDVEVAQWTPQAPGAWQDLLDGADGVVHLAGKNVMDQRWSATVKREIMDSRTLSTQLIVEGIAKASSPPPVLISGSAVGYYGNVDEPVIESSPSGQGFLAEVCKAWEAPTEALANTTTRVVTLRIGLVLGEQGALPKIAQSFRFFVGGHPGNGDQYFPWIHWEDVCRIIMFALDTPNAHGPLNVTSPEPLPIRSFSKVLAQVMKRPLWFPIPEFMLRTVAGEMADALLHGQNAVPHKLQELGFSFKYPDLKPALEELLR